MLLTNLLSRLARRLPSTRDDRGASVVEYALLVVLIAVVCLIAIQVVGQSTSESLSGTAGELGS